MILSGLTSDTFVDLGPRRIVELVQAAGLHGIEWQQYPHVPLADERSCERARSATEEAGLVVISYALERPIEGDVAIDEVVGTASDLGAAALRIRAGSTSIDEAGDEERDRVAECVGECVSQAEKHGLLVALGLNRDSHAANGEQAVALMKRAGADTTHVFWHPSEPHSVDRNVADLERSVECILGLHCTGLNGDIGSTMLSELTDHWARYLGVLRDVDDDHWVSIRGVEGGSVESFYRDAQTLRRLASKYGSD